MGIIRQRADRLLLALMVRVRRRTGLVRAGSSYGGWSVPVSLIRPESVCYLAGVGEDITFDMELIGRTGCTVHAFDPTPRAADHVAAAAAGEPRFVFMPVGLWRADDVMRFYAPADPAHVSHSITNLQGTSSYFEAPCKRLPTLMRELGHSHVDLLKLDIEGAEYGVLDDMLECGLDVRIVCVEFDQPTALRKILAAIRRLQHAGYVVTHRNAFQFTLIKSETRVETKGAITG